MTKRQAIYKSIKTWQGYVDNGRNTDIHECALCDMFIGFRCNRCPLRNLLGINCYQKESLFNKAWRHTGRWSLPESKAEFKKAANEMLQALLMCYYNETGRLPRDYEWVWEEEK